MGGVSNAQNRAMHVGAVLNSLALGVAIGVLITVVGVAWKHLRGRRGR
jgi:hypothetical protein